MRVRVTFARPGFFLADVPVELWIDQRLGYRGSFTSGFEVWAELEPGPHVMRAAIAGPLGVRQKRWQLAVPAGTATEVFTVVLRYSRLWGNFKGKATFAVVSPSVT